jgi:hypothetical protein
MCTRLTRGSLSAGPFVMAAVIAGLTIGLAAAERRGQAKPAPAARATLTFTEFHGAAAVAEYLRQVAGQYPAVTELIEIGRTAGNRPIQVLVVSNMKAGVAIDSLVALQNPRTPPVNNVTPMKAYMGKPGLWLDGGTHGRSLAGTEVCLYAIQKLVSGYGNDAEVTKLVDEDVFYICPLVHDDAPAKAGAPVAETPTPANGNYPEGWWKDDNTPGGTGTYPSSSPEARAVLEFFTNHTNILFAESFHTNGGAALRPFARWPDSRIDPRDAAVFDRVLGKKYLELIGEAVPASWNTPLAAGGGNVTERQPAAGAPAGSGRRGAPAGAAAPGEQAARRGTPPAEQAASWRSAFNQERQAPGAFGAFADWAYGQFGAYAVSIQAWNPQRQGKPVPGEGLADICEAHWQFEKYKATLLPHVAIAEASAKVLYTTSQATRATGVQEGNAVVVKKAGAAPGRYKVVQITAGVTNTGVLPTHVAQGAQLRGNREDVIWLLGDRTKVTILDGARWMRLGVLDGSLALPGIAASPAVGGARGGGGRGGLPTGVTPLAEMRVQRPESAAGRQSGSQRVVSWLVAIDGETPLKLAITSQKGGTAVRDVAIQ